jgi:hypothetical protein
MGRSILVLGRFAADFGGLVAAVQVLSSILALFDRTKSLTDAMLAMPICWAYGVIINGALFVVFGRAMDSQPSPSAEARDEQVLGNQGKREKAGSG